MLPCPNVLNQKSRGHRQPELGVQRPGSADPVGGDGQHTETVTPKGMSAWLAGAVILFQIEPATV